MLVEGRGFVVWFGQYTDIASLVSLFGFTTPAYTGTHLKHHQTHNVHASALSNGAKQPWQVWMHHPDGVATCMLDHLSGTHFRNHGHVPLYAPMQ